MHKKKGKLREKEAINQKTNEEQWKAKAHKIKYQK